MNEPTKDLRTLTKQELTKILDDHLHYLRRDVPDWQSRRAILSHTDLRGADLEGADLRDALLEMADLSGARMQKADLRGADLSHANLREANLREAVLSHAVLSGAIVTNADLSDAYLLGAKILNVDMSTTQLWRANFCSADLSGSVLPDPWNLTDACLWNAKNVPYLRMVCPERGAFIGWKKAMGNLIVKLEIPADARRSSGAGTKCRCDKARVVEVQNISGERAASQTAHSQYDYDFVYRTGKTVQVMNFCEQRFNECAPGIHFFMDRLEAVAYNFS